MYCVRQKKVSTKHHFFFPKRHRAIMASLTTSDLLTKKLWVTKHETWNRKVKKFKKNKEIRFYSYHFNVVNAGTQPVITLYDDYNIRQLTLLLLWWCAYFTYFFFLHIYSVTDECDSGSDMSMMLLVFIAVDTVCPE